ncbi:MAG: hypothetical protein P8127_05960 [Acidobacteriota bacterium]
MRFVQVQQEQTATYRRLLMWGTPPVAVVAIVMPLVHIGALAVVPLVVAAHLVVVRIVLVRDAQRLLRPVRRLLNRWLGRFAFLWLGLPGYGAMTVPVAGIAVGAGTFALLTSIVHLSTAVSLERERKGKELAGWEKTLPITLAVISIVLILLAVAAAALLGWSVAGIMEKMQAR